MRNILLLLSALLVFGLVNAAILEKEQLLRHGNILLLELAPVDPRSMMQGDYMLLNFAIAADIRNITQAENMNGKVIVQVNDRQVASFERPDDGRSLAPDEQRLQYRIRNGSVKFATNAFFFEEGTGSAYTEAQYGEFRVSEEGELILTGLRDENLQPMSP